MRRIGKLMSYAALAFFVAHEVDAVERREWRLLPILGRFDDEIASPAFTALHVPLCVLLLWAADNPSDAGRFRSHLVLDVLLVVHAGLHKLLEDHDLYEFDSRLSRVNIYGAAISALAHSAVLIGEKRRIEA